MKYLKFLSFFVLAMALTAPGRAQTQNLSQNGESQEQAKRIYERPTVKNLSQLYWALSKLDINDDQNIDNYMRINECEIFRDYYRNEFEWRNVREASRNFIKESSSQFPLRFEITVPLLLSEYNFEREGFDLQEGYKIDGIRRFEVLASDYSQDICGETDQLPNYPKGLVVELSRPLHFDFLPMKPDVAKELVNMKIGDLSKYSDEEKVKIAAKARRDVYMILKVKFFSHGEDQLVNGYYLAKGLAVLEEAEIYDTLSRDALLWSYDFRKRKRASEENADAAQQDSPSSATKDGAQE